MQGQLWGAAALFAVSWMAGWADDMLLSEIPGSSSYLIGMGIAGGLTTFPNPLQGAIGVCPPGLSGHWPSGIPHRLGIDEWRSANGADSNYALPWQKFVSRGLLDPINWDLFCTPALLTPVKKFIKHQSPLCACSGFMYAQLPHAQPPRTKFVKLCSMHVIVIHTICCQTAVACLLLLRSVYALVAGCILPSDVSCTLHQPMLAD